MKKTARHPGARAHVSRAARALPGGMPASEFMRDYWQKKPLLVRGAFPGFVDPLTRAEVLTLASREEAESRIVTREGGAWSLTHGPFTRRDIKSLAGKCWTVLVQDTQHFSFESHDLLAAFGFIPHARVDDLMVSYAVPGAGVGPHVDSYDVFLVQGMGRRRWRISRQKDLSLLEDMPVKILADFRPTAEWVLEPGDMLYLPPGVAHDGIAEDHCLTWSVGFRAPSRQELSAAFLDHLRDSLDLDGQYADRDARPTATPGRLDPAMASRLDAMLAPVRKAAGDAAMLRRFLGCHLTEPKPHVSFDAPSPAASPAAFARRARRGVRLDLRTRMLYDALDFYVNGALLPATASERAALRRLADTRRLDAPAAGHLAAGGALYAMYLDGYLEPAVA